MTQFLSAENVLDRSLTKHFALIKQLNVNVDLGEGWFDSLPLLEYLGGVYAGENAAVRGLSF